MINFDFNGIKVEAKVEMVQHTYKDAGKNQRTRFDRNVKVFAEFWDYKIWDENLMEFAFIKSTLQYFMQLYWKRPSKDGRRIDLVKCLRRNNTSWGDLVLFFVARQKNNQYFLQVCLQKEGKTENEVYLDGQEVIMLDIAIGKAINLLSPNSPSHANSIFGC